MLEFILQRRHTHDFINEEPYVREGPLAVETLHGSTDSENQPNLWKLSVPYLPQKLHFSL